MSHERLGNCFRCVVYDDKCDESDGKTGRGAWVRTKSIALDLHILSLYSWVYKRSSGQHR